MTDILVDLNQICVDFEHKQILKSIDLQLKAGEITTIIGPNGAGKSTLIRVVLGLLSPASGKVERKKGLKIGYVPQKLAFNDGFPITVRRFLDLVHKGDEQELNRVMQQTDITALQSQQVRQVSGGELQRVMVARALLQKPQLLVLDEPAQGMDVNAQVALYQLIEQVTAELRCAVLLVSHDLHLVMASSHQVICLNNHHICCSGAPESVAQHPEFAKLFGKQEREMLAIYTHAHYCDDCGHQKLHRGPCRDQ